MPREGLIGRRAAPTARPPGSLPAVTPTHVHSGTAERLRRRPPKLIATARPPSPRRLRQQPPTNRDAALRGLASAELLDIRRADKREADIIIY